MTRCQWTLKVSLIALIAVGITSCGDGGKKSPSSPADDAPTITGVVQDGTGPVYGAAVSAGSATTLTDTLGAFALTVSSDTVAVHLSVFAPGYEAASVMVDSLHDGMVIPSIRLTSLNSSLLTDHARPTSAEEITAALTGLGIEVADDPTNSVGLAPAHVNALASLAAEGRTLTLAEIAAELAVAGVQLDGEAANAERLVAVLQALVDAAYVVPDHPFAVLPQCLVCEDAGSLPPESPRFPRAARRIVDASLRPQHARRRQ